MISNTFKGLAFVAQVSCCIAAIMSAPSSYLSKPSTTSDFSLTSDSIIPLPVNETQNSTQLEEDMIILNQTINEIASGKKLQADLSTEFRTNNTADLQNFLNATSNGSVTYDYEAGKNYNCGKLAYYEISGGRYMALPKANVLQYGSNITNVWEMDDHRCTIGWNLTEQIKAPASQEAILATENINMTFIRDYAAYRIAKREFWSWVGIAEKVFSGVCRIISNTVPNVYTSAACAASGALSVFVGGVDALVAAANAAGYNPFTSTTAADAYDTVEMGLLTSTPQGSNLLSTFEDFAGGGVWKRNDIDWSTPLGYQHPDGSNLTIAHLRDANITHRMQLMYNHTDGVTYPLEAWTQPHPNKPGRNTFHITHAMSVYNSMFNTTTKRKRQTEDVSDPDGALTADLSDPDSADGGPDQVYYGVDVYDAVDITTAAATVGGDIGDDQTNYQGDFLGDIAEVQNQMQAWDSCLCIQDGGQWIATGSYQYSWDDTYNGYSACWDGTCGG